MVTVAAAVEDWAVVLALFKAEGFSSGNLRE